MKSSSAYWNLSQPRQVKAKKEYLCLTSVSCRRKLLCLWSFRTSSRGRHSYFCSLLPLQWSVSTRRDVRASCPHCCRSPWAFTGQSLLPLLRLAQRPAARLFP